MKKRRGIPLVLVLLVLFVIILVIMLVVISKSKKTNVAPEVVSIETSDSTKEKIQKAENEELKKRLASLSEQKRVEYYATTFIKYLQSRNAKNAYSLLNEDFKTNYFATEESFEEYIKLYFPKEMNVNYKNMERLGDIYVLDVDIKDILNTKNPNNFEFYIVVKENDYADYELSFSVDKPMKNSESQDSSEE